MVDYGLFVSPMVVDTCTVRCNSLHRHGILLRSKQLCCKLGFFRTRQKTHVKTNEIAKMKGVASKSSRRCYLRSWLHRMPWNFTCRLLLPLGSQGLTLGYQGGGDQALQALLHFSSECYRILFVAATFIDWPRAEPVTVPLSNGHGC